MNSMQHYDKSLDAFDRGLQRNSTTQEYYENYYDRLASAIQELNLEQDKHDFIWDIFLAFCKAYHAKETERHLKPELERQFKYLVGRL